MSKTAVYQITYSKMMRWNLFQISGQQMWRSLLRPCWSSQKTSGLNWRPLVKPMMIKLTCQITYEQKWLLDVCVLLSSSYVQQNSSKCDSFRLTYYELQFFSVSFVSWLPDSKFPPASTVAFTSGLDRLCRRWAWRRSCCRLSWSRSPAPIVQWQKPSFFQSRI